MGVKEVNSSNFGILNYCILAAMFVISALIGVYMSWKGNKSAEEFLMGNRSFKPLPVAMSLLTSYVSAIILLGFSGEVYGHGMQISIFLLGASLAIFLSSKFILPVIHPLKLTSINEFIELRFRSKHLRSVIAIMSLVKSLLLMGASLYAPTIALVSVTNISVLTYIFLLGVICTAYSSLGGIRAVIWTDVFQLTVMLLGCASVVVLGSVQNGGLINVLHVSSGGGRLEIFDMSFSPYVRHTFINIFISSFFAYGSLFCSEQMVVQRMCAVKSIEDARTMLRYKIFGICLINLLIFGGALVAYATYFGCDPMALGIISRKEEIMTYYINDKLSFIPGLPGIFVATLLGGTLSALSSVINACVAMIWRDICLRFQFFQKSSSIRTTLTNKILSLIVGATLTGLAIIASKAHSLLEYSNTIFYPLTAPVYGVFLIAYCFPKCNLKGVWLGLLTSAIISLLMSIGGLIYKEVPEMLPFSAEDCDNRNITSTSPNINQNFTLSTNVKKETSFFSSFLMSVCTISYVWHSVIGPVVCVVIANIVSFATGNQKIEEVSPKYICHSVRKFYWKKEELERLLKEETELNIYKIEIGENGHGERDKMIENHVAD